MLHGVGVDACVARRLMRHTSADLVGTEELVEQLAAFLLRLGREGIAGRLPEILIGPSHHGLKHAGRIARCHGVLETHGKGGHEGGHGSLGLVAREVELPCECVQRCTGLGLAHQIEAGADIFLMPSRYEPCGLNQMYSMRYGTIPLVRATGGLQDTVQEYNPTDGSGTGFKFGAYEARALLEKIHHALYFYRRSEAWKKMQVNGMQVDNSWTAAAKKYVELYQHVLES